MRFRCTRCGFVAILEPDGKLLIPVTGPPPCPDNFACGPSHRILHEAWNVTHGLPVAPPSELAGDEVEVVNEP